MSNNGSRNPSRKEPRERSPPTDDSLNKTMKHEHSSISQNLNEKVKKRPPQLDEITDVEMYKQEKTPSNLSTTNKSSKAGTPKHILLKFNNNLANSVNQTLNQTENTNNDSINTSTYATVLQRWFGKQPRHEPTKSLVSRMNKTSSLNHSQRDNSHTRIEDKSGYDDVQRLEIMENNLKQIKEEQLVNNNSVGIKKPVVRALRSATLSATPLRNIQNNKSAPGLSIFSKLDPRVENRQVSSPPNARPREIRHQKTMSLKEIKPTPESLMNSLRLRQAKFFGVGDDTLTIRDKSHGIFKSNVNFFRGGPIHLDHNDYEEEERRAWTELNIYERNNMWLTAKNHKIEALSQEKAKKELEGCTFKPLTYSKLLNSSHGNGAKMGGETFRGDNLPSGRGQREHSPTQRGEMGDLLSDRLTARRRSISKEKKQSSSYKQLHELKKNWTESPSSHQPYLDTKRVPSGQKMYEENEVANYFSAPNRPSERTEMNDTIRVQDMISKFKHAY